MYSSFRSRPQAQEESVPFPLLELELPPSSAGEESLREFWRITGGSLKLRFLGFTVGLAMGVALVLLLLPSDVAQRFTVPILFGILAVVAVVAAVVTRPLVRPVQKVSQTVFRAATGAGAGALHLHRMQTDQEQASQLVQSTLLGVSGWVQTLAQISQEQRPQFQALYSAVAAMAEYAAMIDDPLLQRRCAAVQQALHGAAQSSGDMHAILTSRLSPAMVLGAQGAAHQILGQLSSQAAALQPAMEDLQQLSESAREL